MIVRIRDSAGKMRCSDFFRDDEDWQDCAEWLYNTFMRYGTQPRREITAVRPLPFGYHCDAYHVTMKYHLAHNVILFDDPVTVLKEASEYQPPQRKTGAPATDAAPGRTHPPARRVRLDQAETEPIPTSRLPRRTGA